MPQISLSAVGNILLGRTWNMIGIS